MSLKKPSAIIISMLAILLIHSLSMAQSQFEDIEIHWIGKSDKEEFTKLSQSSTAPKPIYLDAQGIKLIHTKNQRLDQHVTSMELEILGSYSTREAKRDLWTTNRPDAEGCLASDVCVIPYEDLGPVTHNTHLILRVTRKIDADNTDVVTYRFVVQDRYTHSLFEGMVFYFLPVSDPNLQFYNENTLGSNLGSLNVAGGLNFYRGTVWFDTEWVPRLSWFTGVGLTSELEYSVELEDPRGRASQESKKTPSRILLYLGIAPNDVNIAIGTALEPTESRFVLNEWYLLFGSTLFEALINPNEDKVTK